MNHYSIKLYDAYDRFQDEETAQTLRDARRIAARLLGHRTLRGASTWKRYQGGTVYQFGRHDESNDCDFAVIELIDTAVHN